jgi:hypothetical protein
LHCRPAPAGGALLQQQQLNEEAEEANVEVAVDYDDELISQWESASSPAHQQDSPTFSTHIPPVMHTAAATATAAAARAWQHAQQLAARLAEAAAGQAAELAAEFEASMAAVSAANAAAADAAAAAAVVAATDVIDHRWEVSVGRS